MWPYRYQFTSGFVRRLYTETFHILCDFIDFIDNDEPILSHAVFSDEATFQLHEHVS